MSILSKSYIEFHCPNRINFELNLSYFSFVYDKRYRHCILRNFNLRKKHFSYYQLFDAFQNHNSSIEEGGRHFRPYFLGEFHDFRYLPWPKIKTIKYVFFQSVSHEVDGSSQPENNIRLDNIH